MKTIAIHQPEYFPWLGFLDKARRADAFVLLDSVQFGRTSMQQRAKVVSANGVCWLTIPFVHRFPQRIDELAPAGDRWRVKHWKTLQACYGRAPGWQLAARRLEAFFSAPFATVCDAAIGSMRMLFEAFGVTTPVLRSSQMAVDGERGDLVLAICRALGATRYLSGRGGSTYLDREQFAAAGIEIDVQSFTAPPYPRPRPIPPEDDRGISALDAWMSLGPEAPHLLPCDPRTGG